MIKSAENTEQKNQEPINIKDVSDTKNFDKPTIVDQLKTLQAERLYKSRIAQFILVLKSTCNENILRHMQVFKSALPI